MHWRTPGVLYLERGQKLLIQTFVTAFVEHCLRCAVKLNRVPPVVLVHSTSTCSVL